jgi:hypothetical protein
MDAIRNNGDELKVQEAVELGRRLTTEKPHSETPELRQ